MGDGSHLKVRIGTECFVFPGQIAAALMLSQLPAGMLCPGVEVTFTCSVTSTLLRWRVSTSTLGIEGQTTFPNDPQLDPTNGMSTLSVGDFMFIARVTSRSPGAVTATLMVTPGSPLNGAQIQCRNSEGVTRSIVLELAGKHNLH